MEKAEGESHCRGEAIKGSARTAALFGTGTNQHLTGLLRATPAEHCFNGGAYRYEARRDFNFARWRSLKLDNDYRAALTKSNTVRVVHFNETLAGCAGSNAEQDRVRVRGGGRRAVPGYKAQLYTPRAARLESKISGSIPRHTYASHMAMRGVRRGY